MPDTLLSVATTSLRWLGDSAQDIWDAAELKRYVREGYAQLCSRAALLWDVTCLEDSATTANTTAEWEPLYFPGGWALWGRMAYTGGAWEAEYAGSGSITLGPSNHTAGWETAYITKTYMRAVHTLPEQVDDIERATWNYKRIEPVTSRELEHGDRRYEVVQGEVLGYVRDKDGLRSFRKWKVPSAPSDAYTVTGTWGALRSVADISSEAVIGTWGCARRVAGEHPSNGTWGTPRRVYKPGKTVQIEFTRRPADVSADGDTFEIPARYVKYLRFYALGKALGRRGPGQDLKLSAHWMLRYEMGVARAKRRVEAVTRNRMLELAPSNMEQKRPPLARFPWNYGRVVR